MPEEDGSSKPSAHYVFAHQFLPSQLWECNGLLSFLADRDKCDEFLIEAWTRLAARSPGLENRNPEGLSATVKWLGGQHQVIAITFPRPRAMTEAFFAAITTSPQIRYITLEYTFDNNEQPSTVLCEWQPEQHLNYGCAAPPNLPAFLRAVCRLLHVPETVESDLPAGVAQNTRALRSRAEELQAQGKHLQAEKAIREWLVHCRRTLPPGDTETLEAMRQLAACPLVQERPEARELCAQRARLAGLAHGKTSPHYEKALGELECFSQTHPEPPAHATAYAPGSEPGNRQTTTADHAGRDKAEQQPLGLLKVMRDGKVIPPSEMDAQLRDDLVKAEAELLKTLGRPQAKVQAPIRPPRQPARESKPAVSGGSVVGIVFLLLGGVVAIVSQLGQAQQRDRATERNNPQFFKNNSSDRPNPQSDRPIVPVRPPPAVSAEYEVVPTLTDTDEMEEFSSADATRLTVPAASIEEREILSMAGLHFPGEFFAGASRDDDGAYTLRLFERHALLADSSNSYLQMLRLAIERRRVTCYLLLRGGKSKGLKAVVYNATMDMAGTATKCIVFSGRMTQQQAQEATIEGRPEASWAAKADQLNRIALRKRARQ